MMQKVHFFDGNIVFGYDGALMDGDNITSLVSTSYNKKEIKLNADVIVFGDSRGYIPDSIKEGAAKVVALRKPFTDKTSDCIIQIIDKVGNTGWVKPSNIKVI